METKTLGIDFTHRFRSKNVVDPPEPPCCTGGGASAGRHSAQSIDCGDMSASSLTGLGTQWGEPLAEHTASQPAGGVALAQGVSTLTINTHSHAPSIQRAEKAAGTCRERKRRLCIKRL